MADSVQAYRISSKIEQSSLFITYCCLYGPCVQEEQYLLQRDSVIQIGNWYDLQQLPIYEVLNNPLSDIKSLYMDEGSYYAYMKEAIDRNVSFLSYLTEAIRKIRDVKQ